MFGQISILLSNETLVSCCSRISGPGTIIRGQTASELPSRQPGFGGPACQQATRLSAYINPSRPEKL